MRKMSEASELFLRQYCHVEGCYLSQLNEDVGSPAWRLDLDSLLRELKDLEVHLSEHLDDINAITGNEFDDLREAGPWFHKIVFAVEASVRKFGGRPDDGVTHGVR